MPTTNPTNTVSHNMESFIAEPWLTSGMIELDGCEPSRVVLTITSGYQPYVVHTECHPRDKTRPPFRFTGFYTNDLTEAVQEFGRRALSDRKRMDAQLNRYREAALDE